ncbi:MAG: type III pantothenate kinase [Herminiimonas sp.]|nr:type III pantothenate kinase [Herminiimonas sp.]
MLLLIDAGNTRIKWALAAPAAPAGQWLASGAVAHADSSLLADQWRQHLIPMPIDYVLVSNVAGPEVRAALIAQLAVLSARAGPLLEVRWFASVASLAGVSNGYHDPASLGCDRFAALIGAWTLHPHQAAIVATCGTATTVDALDAQGRFIGGMILPGLGLMAASLRERAAQLAQVPEATEAPPTGAAEASLFADNTRDAMHGGCLLAQAGAIERAVAAHGGAHCLLSGGAAALVAPYLAIPATSVDNLVLIGLHAVARMPSGAFAFAPSSTVFSGASDSC